MPSLATVIRALDTISFGLCLLGWLLLGVFGTWQDTPPFWIGAPLLWAAALCGLFSLHWGLRGKLSVACLVSVLLFTGYVLWRALNSDVAYLARQDVVFGATAFIGWVLTAARYEKPRHRFALVVVWSLLIVANLGMGLYQKFVNTEANPLSFLQFRRDFADAVFGGFFPNSNHLCGFLELTAFIVLAIAVFGRVHSFVRMLCGLVFAAAAACVALSTSRGGMLAFGAGVGVFGVLALVMHLLRKRPSEGRQRTVVLFALMAAGVIGAGGLAWTQLESKFGEGKVFGNLNGRTALWSRAQEQWLREPILGTGARSFEYYEPSYRNMDTDWITWHETDIDAIFAHNDWIQLLADYGLVGLLLAGLVLGLHCWKGFTFILTDTQRSAKDNGGFFRDHRGAIVMGALCGIIAFAIHCIADFQMHIGVNAVLAAAVLGLMANPGQSARSNAEEDTLPAAPRAGRITATLAAAIPSAALGWHCVPWAIGDYNFQMARGIYVRATDSPEDYFLAAAMMQRAVDADPGNHDAWNYWGFAETGSANLFPEAPVLQLQFLRKSLERFMEAHRLYPQNAMISANIARTLDRLRRSAEAEAWWKKALAWGDGSRLIHWRYADHLFDTGRYQEALDHYWPALHKYAKDGWKRQKVQEGIDRCKKALEEQRKRATAPPAIPAPAPVPAPVPPQ